LLRWTKAHAEYASSHDRFLHAHLPYNHLLCLTSWYRHFDLPRCYYQHSSRCCLSRVFHVFPVRILYPCPVQCLSEVDELSGLPVCLDFFFQNHPLHTRSMETKDAFPQPQSPGSLWPQCGIWHRPYLDLERRRARVSRVVASSRIFILQGGKVRCLP